MVKLKTRLNARIINKYRTFLKGAKQQDEKSVDAALKAINRYEEFCQYSDFKKFRVEQAISFKKHLKRQISATTGKPLSKSTLNTIMHHLKAFFQWLSMQSGYRSKVNYSDALYFSLSRKETRVANSSQKKPIPTLEQIIYVLELMPSTTAIELRDRAVIATVILTGARDSAIASLKIKHVDLIQGGIHQDAKEVDTKYSKTFTSYFFPVGDLPVEILAEWISFLTEKLSFSPEDPLFPKTKVETNAEKQFEAAGFLREHWSNTNSIRRIFNQAFTLAELPYFNPHSFRKTLVTLGENLCRTPEEFKAWSQNLGHENVLTTFFDYGTVPDPRQAELLRKLAAPSVDVSPELLEQFKQFIQFQEMLEKKKT